VSGDSGSALPGVSRAFWFGVPVGAKHLIGVVAREKVYTLHDVTLGRGKLEKLTCLRDNKD
jgi:hypothetical protein